MKHNQMIYDLRQFLRVGVLICGTFAFLLTSPAVAQSFPLMPITQSWRYSTNNLDAVNWKTVGYAETGWSNLSPALLYIEGVALPAPKNTLLPHKGDGNPRVTYYFRTTFNMANAAVVSSLTFSNLIDDGAVFYLNGVEVQRVGMPGGAVTYSTFATRSVGDATTFDVFSISGDLLTNLVTGNNVLAAEVHQINAGSSDIVFGTALLYATNMNLIRGPYLQNGSHTNVVVRWRTDANSIGRVRYGTNLANLDLFVDEPATTNEHQVNVTGLLPDTKYFYSIGTAATTLAGSNNNHLFVTAPVPGTPRPTRIWIIGDSGTGTSDQINCRNAYETFTGARHTDLWLMLGDNAYDDGTDAEYQATVFQIYTNLLRKSVLWPALGNHDTAQDTALSDNFPYFDIFTLPKNGEAGGFASGSEHYFSFDYGNIHFICLDSMTASFQVTNSPMFIWLTNDLANVTADWTIAFWHHPPYTKGSHDSDAEADLGRIRRVFLPVLEDAGVDLVFAGHSHVYERSFLMDKHYSVSAGYNITNKIDGSSGNEPTTGAYKKPEGGPASHQGTVYAVVGSSGHATGGSLNHPAMYKSLNFVGSMVLDISTNRLDARFVRLNGTIDDFFTILKVNYPPVASNLIFNVPADVSTPLALRGSDLNGDAITFTTNSLPARGLISNFNPANGAFVYTPAHAFSGSGSFNVSASDGLTNSALASITVNVQSPQDLDADGIPDAWESAYGTSNPDGDNDADGLTNLQEYLANTNPTNAASNLRITSAVVDDHFSMTWTSVGGTRYRVQYKNGDITAPFLDLTQHVTLEMDPLPPGTPSTRAFTDDYSLTGVLTNGSRFFRVQVIK